MNKQTTKIIRFYLPTILWGLVIFTFSNRQSIETTDFYLGDFLLKKTAHFAEYTIFAILTYRTLLNTTTLRKSPLCFAVFAISVLYALSDEIHQTLVPSRDGTLRDVAIDSFGSGVAIIVLYKYMRSLPQPLFRLAHRFHLIV